VCSIPQFSTLHPLLHQKQTLSYKVSLFFKIEYN
jgi:hypothetical protein